MISGGGASPSSVTHDLRDKAAEYLQLPSLSAYLVLAQDEAKAWVWAREAATFLFCLETGGYPMWIRACAREKINPGNRLGGAVLHWGPLFARECKVAHQSGTPRHSGTPRSPLYRPLYTGRYV